ncbi:TetR/AcrR family transcriptional regulator [Actinomadura craniellae]|uniref:TetR/AcrR family transcriptional regulator n=1 Tax=Actinomadura craniellae TaxID=2231787 RepID=A0A365H407_9ACTN|nr:TetR/AcrR family transcriptional regulator [Actinomadura craniellae]RAY13746.1 TetR/AcrR family transcriptional regulator [Actinomadura craniellae]
MAGASRERIEVVAAELLARHGYHGLGLKALSQAAGLPYGSIYHHFPGGKEEIAVAAITGCGERLGGMIRGLPDQAVVATGTMFEAMVWQLSDSDWGRGCPIGTPALDGATESAAVREAVAGAFAAMTSALAERLAALGVPGDRADHLATTIIAAYEGATMLARAQRSPAPLQAAGEAMTALVRAALPETP